MRIKRILQSDEIPLDDAIDIHLIKDIVAKYKGKKEGLIALLQEVQTVYTFLPKPALQFIESELNYTLGELYAVATFYAQFKLSPSGKYSIKICKGTACHVQNVNAVMDEIASYLKIGDGETTPDGKYTLESVSCLGCCSLAPAMMIGEETFGKLNGENAINYIKNFEQ
jgi:NADH-quinone oxidoreductase subunit E